MEHKPKTYWQEFYPLWVDGVKSWFGWAGWKKSVTSLVVAVGMIYVFFALDQTEDAINDIQRLFYSSVIGVVWLLYVAIVSYVTANIKLYESQLEKRKRLGDFSTNPFRVELFMPDLKVRRSGPKRLSLEINNSFPTKKIENCYVSLENVFDVKNRKAPERLQQNLMWNAREQNQCQPLNISAGGRVVCDVVIEEGPTTVYYLTWISEKMKRFVDPGEYVLCFSVFGDWDNISSRFFYYCTMIVEHNYETLLKDLREGSYEPEQSRPHRARSGKTPVSNGLHIPCAGWPMHYSHDAAILIL